MKSILKEMDRLRKYVHRRELCLFLEYDGTLTPFVEAPEKAVLNSEIRNLLKELASMRSCHVHVLSGRSQSDVKQMVSLDSIDYIGNHGFEMDKTVSVFSSTDFEATKRALNELKKEIKRVTVQHTGSFLEDKGLSLSIHYRKTSSRSENIIKEQLYQISQQFLFRGEVTVDEGRKVFEIKPPIDWDKGQSILCILDNYKRRYGRIPAAIFVGDDQTEEHVFRSLKGKVLLVKVGSDQTIADYYLQEQRKVADLLKLILRFKRMKWLEVFKRNN